MRVMLLHSAIQPENNEDVLVPLGRCIGSLLWKFRDC